MSELQAAVERRAQYWRAESNQSPSSRAEDQERLADYGARCTTLVPQLVAALKAARGFIASTSHSVTGIERQIDAAIAAGEGERE